MSGSTGSTIPGLNAPIVDPTTGLLTPMWSVIMLQLWNRTGGGGSNAEPIGQEALDAANSAKFLAYAMSSLASGGSGAPGPVVSVTPSVSPYTYTAGQKGVLLISGGGISRVQFSRDGTTWIDNSGFYSPLPMASGDRVKITYQSITPALAFAPFG